MFAQVGGGGVFQKAPKLINGLRSIIGNSPRLWKCTVYVCSTCRYTQSVHVIMHINILCKISLSILMVYVLFENTMSLQHHTTAGFTII